MKFKIDQGSQDIRAELKIDDEGDLALLLNGIPVLYLGVENAAIHRCRLYDTEAEAFQRLGFDLVCDTSGERILDIGMNWVRAKF